MENAEEILNLIRLQQTAITNLMAKQLAMQALINGLLITHPDARALIEAHARAIDHLTDEASDSGGEWNKRAVGLTQNDHEILLTLLNQRTGNPG